MQRRRRLTYANVVSTLALFLAITGGVVYAASKIRSHDLAKHAVKSSKIANGAVKTKKIAKHAVGSAQIKNNSVGPSKQSFPVFYVVSPSGGSAPVTTGPDPYPVSHHSWTQNPGQINILFGAATATLAYDGSGSGSCRVSFEIQINGQQVGGDEISTSSTTPTQVDRNIGAQPELDPTTPTQQKLKVLVGSNGDCTGGSTIDSTHFRVLDFG